MRVPGAVGSFRQKGGTWVFIRSAYMDGGRRQFTRGGFATLEEAVSACKEFGRTEFQVLSAADTRLRKSDAYRRAAACILAEDLAAFDLAPREPDGFVYVLRLGKYLKIGFSKDPRTRAWTIRHGRVTAPADTDFASIEHVVQWAGGRVLETRVLHLFRNYRVVGEFFLADPAVLGAVDVLSGALSSTPLEHLESAG